MRVIVGRTTDTALEVQTHSALGKLDIPADAVLGIVLTPPNEGEDFDPLWEQVRGEPRSTDVIWMANGDRLTGAFLGLDDRVVKFQVEGKPVEIDRTGVLALGSTRGDQLSTSAGGLPGPVTRGRHAARNDRRQARRGQLSGVTRFGQPVRFPIGDLVRVDPRTPRSPTFPSSSPMHEQYVSYSGPRGLTVRSHRRRSSLPARRALPRARPGDPEPDPTRLSTEAAGPAIPGASGSTTGRARWAASSSG